MSSNLVTPANGCVLLSGVDESTDSDNLAFSPVLLLSVSLPIYFKFPHSSYIGMPMPAVFGRVISNTCLLQAM